MLVLMDYDSSVYKSLRWPQSLLGRLETLCGTGFHYLQFGSK